MLFFIFFLGEEVSLKTLCNKDAGIKSSVTGHFIRGKGVTMLQTSVAYLLNDPLSLVCTFVETKSKNQIFRKLVI